MILPDLTTVTPRGNAARERGGESAESATQAVLLRAPPASPVALQEWEGSVVHIGERDFTARLTAGASSEDEETTILLAEIAEDDAERMLPGSVFRQVIGYECSPSGTAKLVSQIMFRVPTAVTQLDRRQGAKCAREAPRSFGL